MVNVTRSVCITNSELYIGWSFDIKAVCQFQKRIPDITSQIAAFFLLGVYDI